jgi:hypothetical protein
MRLDRPALTPALTEIRLFALATGLVVARHAKVPGCEFFGLAASWLCSSRRQAHFLLRQQTLEILKPNVRANRAATAGRQGPGCENAPCATDRALVACRCCSG